MDIGVGRTQSQTVTIQTGTYRVIERPVPAGYARIYSEGCTGTLTGQPLSETSYRDDFRPLITRTSNILPLSVVTADN